MVPVKVLVVDDDKEFLNEVKDALVDTGYDVNALNESTSAIKVARVTKPDVILLDLRMRAVSGFEIADSLKRFPETACIPVIAMTGFYTHEDHSWLLKFCGIKKCLKKPFDPLDVIAEIRCALKEKAGDKLIENNKTGGGEKYAENERG